MLRKPETIAQLSFLQPGLKEQLSNKHPLYILAEQINWQLFEKSFRKHYREDFGRPAKPIRLMVALMMLKHIRNLSDESVVEQWSENGYYQYFSGGQLFTPVAPCEASELALFTKVLKQKKQDKNKIYSLHEPDVKCISKGKEHKKYEFGSKVSITITRNSGVIIGALNIPGNDYDGHTLDAAIEPQIGHLKADHRLSRNFYKGIKG